MYWILLSVFASLESLLSYLHVVANQPSHISTKLAMALPLFLYTSGGLRTSTPVGPVKTARCVDRTTVRTIALDRAKQHASTEQIRHAFLTPIISCLSGQKRSKKKAAPKIVATKTPTKMLYEKDLTKSSLSTVTDCPLLAPSLRTAFC